MGNDVVAVLVTFNPDPALLIDALGRLVGQVARTVIVDNASSLDIKPIIQASANPAVELLTLAENTGIGAAQNTGIERARAIGAGFVLLLDQDSKVTGGMVQVLRSAFDKASQCAGERPVAAVGPACLDAAGQMHLFFPADGFWPKAWLPPSSSAPIPDQIETAFLVASGTLIPAGVLDAIGGMRSDYFIDHVDREWCFRAIAQGYRLLGITGAVLEHQVGSPSKLALGRWVIHYRWQAPARNYYMFRNAILMLRDTRVPLGWQAYLFVRLIRYAAGAILLLDNRRVRFGLIAKGVFHGLRGIRGRLILNGDARRR